MKLDIITAEEACKLVDEKSGGIPPEFIDEALNKVDRTIRLTAAYDDLDEYTFDVGRLFFTNTGVVFSEEDMRKDARKIARTLREKGYKVFFAHIGSFEPNLEYFDYREGMTVSWCK